MKKIVLFFVLITTLNATAQLTDIVTSGLTDPFDVVIEGNEAYIVEFAGSTISRIDITDPNPVLENVVTNIANPTTLLFDNDDVYIAQVNGLITRRDASDLTSNQTTIASGLVTPVSLVRDGDFLYFSEFQGSRIGRIDLANGNTVETVIAGLNFPEQIALIGNQLYITISGSGIVSRINIDEANPQLETVATGLVTPAGLVAVGNSLFVTEFTQGGGVFNIDTAAANPTATELVSGLSSPFGISFADDALYFVQNGNNRLSRYEGDLLSITDNEIITSGFNVYPNPNTGSFRFAAIGSTPVLRTEVYDLVGKMVAQIDHDILPLTQNTLIQLNLKSGTYIAALITEEGTIRRKFSIR